VTSGEENRARTSFNRIMSDAHTQFHCNLQEGLERNMYRRKLGTKRGKVGSCYIMWMLCRLFQTFTCFLACLPIHSYTEGFSTIKPTCSQTFLAFASLFKKTMHVISQDSIKLCHTHFHQLSYSSSLSPSPSWCIFPFTGR